MAAILKLIGVPGCSTVLNLEEVVHPTNLKLVIQGDLGNPAFTSESLGMDRELYFTVMNHLPTVFPVINEAQKVYMTRGEYPSSSVDKFLKFL